MSQNLRLWVDRFRERFKPNLAILSAEYDRAEYFLADTARNRDTSEYVSTLQRLGADLQVNEIMLLFKIYRGLASELRRDVPEPTVGTIIDEFARILDGIRPIWADLKVCKKVLRAEIRDNCRTENDLNTFN